MDNNSEIFTNNGGIGPVGIGGNLDNGASIYTENGNLGSVHIAKNLDHGAQVYAEDAAAGVGNVWVGGNFSNGAAIYSESAAIQSVKILGDSLWTSGDSAQITAATTIGSISIGGNAIRDDFEAGGSIGSIKIGGLMQNGTVNLGLRAAVSSPCPSANSMAPPSRSACKRP